MKSFPIFPFPLLATVVGRTLPLASVWRSLPRQSGFFVVVELDDREAAVIPNDAIPDILTAEAAAAPADAHSSP